MVDWDSWQKHVDYVARERGRWVGLGDGDGNPLMDLPDAVEISAPDQWMEASDISVKLPGVDDSGEAYPFVHHLILEAMDRLDESGQIPPDSDEELTILIAVRGENGEVVRSGGVITHVTGDDPDDVGAPSTVTINALAFMDVWNTVPAVSWPAAWWKARPYERTSDESGIEYPQPWSMARVELATRTTFTLKNGKAGFIIRRLAQESLDAVMAVGRDPDGTTWVDDPYHVVEVPEVDNTPEISLEARDGSLWETVATQAKNAGVILGARMWWPGDAPVRCWSPVTSTADPRDVDISPSQGASSRIVGERSFPHPMIVLTVREV